MGIKRVVPNVQVDDMERSRAFYRSLGFTEVMNLGWIVTLASPDQATAQISLFTDDKTGPVVPDVSIEVTNVDELYAESIAANADIVHPLTDEDWGVRRFFVRSPDGQVANILQHRLIHCHRRE
ncbi:VOC family protein [Haloglycomyces albus]|uniref:VOC family protein n=1 Tax=Haloglycomyces albus TaxID=526067 RepID=UPI00046CE0B3|nr:VOC family protein [Haloglycomyces albus]